MKMNIRPYTVDDIDLIAPLFDEFVQLNPLLPYKQNALEIYIKWLYTAYNEPDIRIYVVEQGHSIIGFAVGMIRPNKPLLQPEKIGFIGMFIVQSEFRRRGIGHSLYQQLLEWFVSRDVPEIQLTTEVTNTIANKFWESIGFKTNYEQKSLKILGSVSS